MIFLLLVEARKRLDKMRQKKKILLKSQEILMQDYALSKDNDLGDIISMIDIKLYDLNKYINQLDIDIGFVEMNIEVKRIDN